jgi:hypothetical protein
MEWASLRSKKITIHFQFRAQQMRTQNLQLFFKLLYSYPRSTPMRFLCLYKPAVTSDCGADLEKLQKMEALVAEMMREGTLLSTEGCQPSEKGARVRLKGTEYAITDGPFTESKEIIGGFAILRADSMAHAIQLTKRFLSIAGEGETEIRQLYEAEDFAHTK